MVAITIFLIFSLILKCSCNSEAENVRADLQKDYDDEDLLIESEGFNIVEQQIQHEGYLMNTYKLDERKSEKKKPKSFPAFLSDNHKIQSNNKNLENYSNSFFVYDKNIIVLPKLPKNYELMNNEEMKYAEAAMTSTRTTKKIKKHFPKKLKQMDKSEKSKGKNRRNHNKFRLRRAVTAKKERIWDYGVIPYEIDTTFSGIHKALFKQAMRHWENYTCIKFVERDEKLHPNYIYFTVRNCGCCSFVGKRGNGRQAISIGRNCEKFGIVVHELGHVIGFWHEHTRVDRDKHIKINRENILKGQEYNFNVLSADDVDSLGMPYDYASIMHYAKNTFSKSMYLDTIVPIAYDGKINSEIGQRLHLSNGDIGQANLLYKCLKCGKTFQQYSGQIILNNLTALDGNDDTPFQQCEWRITATIGERIILRIHELQIGTTETSEIENCNENYLEIRDGYWYKSPLIKKFCTNVNSSIEILTDSSRMLLTYVSRNVPRGFYKFVADFEVICGGEIIIDESRRIDSPNYPIEYLPDKECIWKITVEENYQVALKFLSFEIENNDNCIFDYVEIRDGHEADSELIGVFCGYKLPPNIKSISNKMFLKFVSDSSVQKVGFSAVFMKEFDECETGEHDCQHECINKFGGYECSCNAGYELQVDGKSCEDACGGRIYTANNENIIHSPSYPDVYPISKKCIWEIIAPEKQNIFLNFTHFDLEGTKHQYKECNYDYISIYSKLKDNRLRKIGIYCGNELPPFIQSEQNILRVEFHSDKSIQHTGFHANILTDINECSTQNGGCQHYCKNTFGSYVCSCRNGFTLSEDQHNCTETKCKFEITTSYGVVRSPNYPQNYPRNIYCYWHFTTVPGHRIQLTFLDFEVESHQECIYDYIGVYDGKSENSSTLGVYCGGREPYTVLASTNEMYMVLRTDIGLQKKGFMATHSTECGGYLRATNQTKNFYSHVRYGQRQYKRDMYCVWRIQADQDSSVKLNFISFSIEYSDKCDYDFVEITEEYSHTKKSRHGKFCGNIKPPVIISYSDNLIVKFESDSSTGQRGFAVSYVAVEPPPETDDLSNDYDDTVTPFPGYHKSIYYDADNDYDHHTNVQNKPQN